MFEDTMELEEGRQSSIFPFLSILFCTIGSLLIIMVIGAAKTTMKDETINAQIAKARQKEQSLEELTEYGSGEKVLLVNTSQVESDLSTLRQNTDEIRAELAKESTGFANLRRKSAEASSRKEKVELVFDKRRAALSDKDLTNENEITANNIGEKTRQIKALKSSFSSLTAGRDDLKSKIDSPEVRFLQLDKDSGLTPVYLELAEDFLKVLSEGTSKPSGTKVPTAKALGDGGYIEELAAELARPGGSRYVMLLVRPGAVGLFHAAKDKFQKWRAPCAYEPVDKNWQFVFEGPNAGPD